MLVAGGSCRRADGLPLQEVGLHQEVLRVLRGRALVRPPLQGAPLTQDPPRREECLHLAPFLHLLTWLDLCVLQCHDCMNTMGCRCVADYSPASSRRSDAGRPRSTSLCTRLMGPGHLMRGSPTMSPAEPTPVRPGRIRFSLNVAQTGVLESPRTDFLTPGALKRPADMGSAENDEKSRKKVGGRGPDSKLNDCVADGGIGRRYCLPRP
jgi:hypothetical protein